MSSVLVKHFFEGKEPPKHPVLKILFGLPGSGKGTITTKYRLLNKNTITFNYDELIMSDKEYQEKRKLAKTKEENQTLYWLFRKKYAELDDKVNKKALKDGYSILWETTGANIGWMPEHFQNFHKKGYRIMIHMPITDFTQLVERILLREKITGQEGAPISQLQHQKELIYSNFIKLIPIVDKLYLYDNTFTQTKRVVTIRKGDQVECTKNFTKGFLNILERNFDPKFVDKIKKEKSCFRL